MKASVVWCGVYGTPHRLRSSVLTGRDNYTEENKVCAEADRSYTTDCRLLSHLARQAESKETKNQTLSCLSTHYNYVMHVFLGFFFNF